MAAHTRLLLPAVGLTIVALASACMKEEADPASRSVPPAAPVAVTNDQPGDPIAPSSAGGPQCEELGSLVGNAVQAKLSTATQRSLSLPLANRPVPSRIGVVGVGPAADLVGKTVALGVAENANYETCTHCVVIALGCTATDCSNAAWFYPRAGTATFTAVASQSGQPFAGTFSDVTLEEVTVDAGNVTTPVKGGACIHIGQLSFDGIATTPLSAPPAPSTASSTSSSGGTDGGITSPSQPGTDVIQADAGSSSGSSGTGSSGGTGKGGEGSDQCKNGCKDPFNPYM